jgi:hypothetical protein
VSRNRRAGRIRASGPRLGYLSPNSSLLLKLLASVGQIPKLREAGWIPWFSTPTGYTVWYASRRLFAPEKPSEARLLH